MSERETLRAVIPEGGLWSEGGDRCWLSTDYADNPTRVRRLFFIGRGIPTVPAREGVSYQDLRVREVFIRPGYSWEEGWAGKGADTWWYAASSRDPNVVKAWEIFYA